MHIGTAAKRIGLSVDAIRFYERNSLLPRVPRTVGGFREYRDADLETLEFIRRVQGLGFKLREIRGLLDLRASRFQPCAPVRRRLLQKLLEVRQKIAALRRLQRDLRLALGDCDRELRKPDAHCPILKDRRVLAKELGE